MFKPCKPMSMGVMIAIAVAIATAISVGHSKAATPYPDAATARFEVMVTGTGPDVILIPGLASSAATWDGTVDHLKGRYRLHVLNLAGFAGVPAAANAEGEVLAPSVDALDAYIKANHLQKPVVVGHSLGGLMSMMLAKAHPEDAGKLVIVDALPYIGVLFNPNATVATVKPQAGGMRDSIMALPADAFKTQQTATAASLVTSAANQAKVLDWSLTSDRRVMAQALYDDLVTDMRPDLKAIATPATVIFANAYGADTIYRASYAGKADITFAGIADSRHFVMLDQPDAFYSALDAALK